MADLSVAALFTGLLFDRIRYLRHGCAGSARSWAELMELASEEYADRWNRIARPGGLDDIRSVLSTLITTASDGDRACI